jgi:chromate transporter
MVAPICILLILASLYDQFSHLPAVNIALMGGAAAASGMIIGTGLKMAQKIKPGLAGWLIIAAALLGILVLKWPLVYVVLGLIPVALALTYWLPSLRTWRGWTTPHFFSSLPLHKLHPGPMSLS